MYTRTTRLDTFTFVATLNTVNETLHVCQYANVLADTRNMVGSSDSLLTIAPLWRVKDQVYRYELNDVSMDAWAVGKYTLLRRSSG